MFLSADDFEDPKKYPTTNPEFISIEPTDVLITS